MQPFIQLFLFIGLILGLNFFRNFIAHTIQKISFLIFRSPVPGVIFYSLLFLPGVIIHELSHLIVAEVLGVRTGQIKIFPEEIKSGNLRMGSVQSVASDPFRETLIGAAPFFTGLVLITSLVLWQIPTQSVNAIQAYLTNFSPSVFIVIYLIFTSANTMFVSKEDRRAWWILPIFILLIGSAIYVFNLKFITLLEFISNWIQTVNFALTFCLIIDFVFAIFLQIILNLSEKSTGMRIVHKKDV